MNVRWLAACAFSAAVALAPAAKADDFAFSFSGGTISSSGVFSAVQTSTAGEYQITGISGEFTDTSEHISGAITGLYTPISYAVPPGFTSGGFSYDDTFWLAGNSPHDCSDYPYFGGDFDVYGLVFNVAGGFEGGIWSDGFLPNVGLVYGAGDATTSKILNNPGQGNGVPVTFAFTAAPEPKSMLLFGIGFVALLVTVARRRMRSGAINA